MKIGILGGGVMGTVLLRAIAGMKLLPAATITICDRSGSARARIKQISSRAAFTTDAADFVGASILFLAVKPQDFASIALKVSKSTLVVSIMAGVPIRVIKRQLGAAKVIRAMPNTPAGLGKGFTAWTATANVTRGERALARRIFGKMGDEIYVRSEDAVNKFTAISGSGPAYFFYTTLCFINAATALGVPRRDAERAVRQTLDGAAALLSLEGDIAQRIAQVASKGGTTEAALTAFREADLEKMWTRALRAAYLRAQALAAKSAKRGK